MQRHSYPVTLKSPSTLPVQAALPSHLLTPPISPPRRGRKTVWGDASSPPCFLCTGSVSRAPGRPPATQPAFTNAHPVAECSPVLADYTNLPPAPRSAVLSEDSSGLTHSPDPPRKPEFRVGAPPGETWRSRTCGTKSGRSRWPFPSSASLNPRPALPSPGHWGTLQDDSRCCELGWKHKITLVIRVLNPRKVRPLEKLLLTITLTPFGCRGDTQCSELARLQGQGEACPRPAPAPAYRA